MVKEKADREKDENLEGIETLNVGIVGHIDHGKTTLLHRLSGKWADSHSEELKRGITIKLGYADIIIYDDHGKLNKDRGRALKHVSFVDAPGHEMLMATMLSGAAMIDAAILVVAANEGIKPQTREHLMALQAKDVKHLIVVQNKIDLVDLDRAKKNYKEIRDLLKGKYDDALIIPVSAQQDVNIEEIYKALVDIPVLDRNKDEIPIFIIARSFDINKPGVNPEDLHGAVLGGTLKQGLLKVGDEIEIKPGRVIKEANQYYYKTIKTKILGLYKGSKKVQELYPGGSMSIETELDMALGKGDALAECVVSHIGDLPEISDHIKVKYKLFPEVFGIAGHINVDPLKVSETLLLNVNTSMTLGIVKKIVNNQIEFSLKVPIVPCKGDNVAIARNFNNHWRLIGYGEIL